METPDTDKLRELLKRGVSQATWVDENGSTMARPVILSEEEARGLLSVLDALEAKDFGGRYRALVDRCHAAEAERDEWRRLAETRREALEQAVGRERIAEIESTLAGVPGEAVQEEGT